MRQEYTIDYYRPTTNIEKKNVILNLIKILLQDNIYYEELEYILEYRAYNVFNP